MTRVREALATACFDWAITDRCQRLADGVILSPQDAQILARALQRTGPALAIATITGQLAALTVPLAIHSPWWVLYDCQRAVLEALLEALACGDTADAPRPRGSWRPVR